MKILTRLEQRYDALGLFPDMSLPGKILASIGILMAGLTATLIWVHSLLIAKVVLTLSLIGACVVIWLLIQEGPF